MGVPVNQLPEDLAGDIQERDLEDGKKLQLAPSPSPNHWRLPACFWAMIFLAISSTCPEVVGTPMGDIW